MARKKTKVKEKIARHALKLFVKKGYAGASVSEIARASGVTKPTIYYYFGSKRGLYESLIGEGIKMMNKALGHAAATPGDAAEKLIELARTHLKLYFTNRELALFFFGLVFGPESGRASLKFPEEGGHESIYKEVVQKGVASGEFRPVNPEGVHSLLEGSALVCIMMDLIRGRRSDEKDILELENDMIDIIIHGMKGSKKHPRGGKRK